MLHKPSGRRLLGTSLAVFAALQWGALPVILKILVKPLDVYTIGWIRFLVSALLIAPLVMRRQGLLSLLRLRGWPLAFGGLGVFFSHRYDKLIAEFETFGTGILLVLVSGHLQTYQEYPSATALTGIFADKRACDIPLQRRIVDPRLF